MSLLNNIKISCKQATYLHQKKMEGKLLGLERLGLWVHLLYCGWCNRFIRQVELLQAKTQKFYQTAEQRFQMSATRKAEMQRTFEEALKK